MVITQVCLSRETVTNCGLTAEISPKKDVEKGSKTPNKQMSIKWGIMAMT